MRIKLTDNFPQWPLMRQTPGGRGRWEDCEFARDFAGEVDAWVVYEGMLRPERVLCPPQRVIFVGGEPPAIRPYSAKFLDQFAAVVSCQTSIRHPGLILRQQAQPWNLGIVRNADKTITSTINYDQFAGGPQTLKTGMVAVVSTRKAMTEGHRQRIRFIETLKEILGDLLHVYWLGPGNTDKTPSILPYRYHIAIENSRVDHYWTEKLADAYLGRAYPFYFGCPNLSEYFPPESFTHLDVADAPGSAAQIRQAVEQNRYEASRAAIDVARTLVLDRYNVFPMLADLCRNLRAGPGRRVRLEPEQTITLRLKAKSAARRLINAAKSLGTRA